MMRKLITIISTVLLTASLFAQSPQKMSYQAVIRDDYGELVQSHAVGMQISILKDENAVFVETHSAGTNENGLVTLEIGGGTFVSGVVFSAIDWSDGTYFIKTETDPTGGTNYAAIVGTSQILSVPYALHAKTAASYTETDPEFTAWDKSTGISIPASQVSDFQTSVTNNADVLANTAKITNATHSGDVTGTTGLTLATVNSDVGTFNNITINAKGLATAGSNVSYLTSETDQIVKAITGIVKSDGTTISAATAGTDYLTPTGSAALLTNWPIFNQNTTGNAATVTTNADLTGDVISTGNATIIANKQTMTATAPVSVTGSPTVIASGAVAISIAAATTSQAGSMSAADKTKLDVLTIPVHTIGESYGGGIIFYLDASGQHGLIAATTDQGQGIYWDDGTPTLVYAFASSVGGGYENTWWIVSLQGAVPYAAQLCDNLITGDYGDWYLPSRYELNLMYSNIGQGNLLGLGNVGGFANTYYWSSTEYIYNTAWVQYFNIGNQIIDYKYIAHYVRAIRSF